MPSVRSNAIHARVGADYSAVQTRPIQRRAIDQFWEVPECNEYNAHVCSIAPCKTTQSDHNRSPRSEEHLTF